MSACTYYGIIEYCYRGQIPSFHIYVLTCFAREYGNAFLRLSRYLYATSVFNQMGGSELTIVIYLPMFLFSVWYD